MRLNPDPTLCPNLRGLGSAAARRGFGEPPRYASRDSVGGCEGADTRLGAGLGRTRDTEPDVFVLDMHEPIRIVDLAKKMVHLMGYDIKDENSYRGDIAIEYTGLRPGEKLYEELLIGESVTGTEHPKIMRAEEETLFWETLEPLLNRLEKACQNIDLQEIREVLIEAVDGFEPKEEASDPLWKIQNAVSDTAVSAKTAGEGTVTPLFKE